MRPLAILPLFVLALAAHAAPSPQDAAKKIDAILQADWQKAKLQGNPAADDNTFVRRLYLDIIGRIPTTREAEDFLASKDADKRSKLIDKLLGSEAYVQHMYNYWADVLRLTSTGNQTGAITGAAYVNFVKDSLRQNKPFDQFVRDMVSAQGKAWENGAIGYYMRDRGMPLDNMANTVRVFLGTRIECAQCHNHPFDKWSQMQFFKMAAFTYGVQTQDYYGGTIGEVRDLLKEKEDAAAKAIAEPTRPQRPNKVQFNGKVSKEDRQKLSKEDRQKLEKSEMEERQKLEKEFAAKLQKYNEEDKAYQVALKDTRKKQEEARSAIRKEHRNFQQPMNDISDTMRYTSVSERDRKVTLPHDYQYTDAKPKSVVTAGTMMGHECVTQPGETPLQAYARWMTAKENPRFTTVIANRLWKKAFGLALIEPLDELMDGTIPMVPELQTHLDGLIKDLKYDMKAYLRVLYNTSTYQRQATREEIAPGIAYHFTGPVLRRMTAEQMWDSFVTLVNPNPDMINASAREAMEQRILQAKKNAEGIEALNVEEAYKGLKMAADVYARNKDRTDEKQKGYLDARAAQKELQEKLDAMKPGPEREAMEKQVAEAQKKVQAFRTEVNTIQGEGRRMTAAQVIVPGHKKLYEKVTGKPYQNVALNKPGKPGEAAGEIPSMMTGESMMMMGNGIRAERVSIPGYDRKELTPEQRKADELERQEAYKEEAVYYGIPEKQQRDYFRARSQQARDYVRAAELESPAPRGHPLRDFGQSDRETIENASYDASVPQSLFMMNGNLMPNILSKYSQLMLAISKAQYPDDKLEAAYTAILSRKPTAKEKETWLKAQDNGLTTTEDLIYALLNTQQFIFIQ
ncbi:MAG: DUF1549 domain-containing protein [Verrucomicrobiota bacterium]